MDRKKNLEQARDRDALHLVRNHRAAQKTKSNFYLSTPIKVSAMALIFVGAIAGVWTMRSSSRLIMEKDLPLLNADFNGEEFKVAPDESETFRVPHEDKTLYSEFEPQNQRKIAEKLRPEPEIPQPQISQEELMLKAELGLEQGDQENQGTVIPLQASKTLDHDLEALNKTNQEPVTVVESVGPGIDQALQQPSSLNERPSEKTFEMALIDKSPKGSLERAADLNTNTPQNDKADTAQFKTYDASQKQDAKKLVQADHKTQFDRPALPERHKVTYTSNMPSATHEGYWIQLASLPTEAAAKKEWQRVQNKCSVDVSQKDLQVVRVDLGKPKGVRYRLQCGPFPRTVAIDKCRGVKAKGVGCLVVKK